MRTTLNPSPDPRGGLRGGPTADQNHTHLFASESVSAGHPDKLADQISDAVLDHLLARDPTARVACESVVMPGLVVIGGEVAAHKDAVGDLEQEAEALARAVLRDAGYGAHFPGIDPDGCEVLVRLGRQSPDIARGVLRPDGRLGAGDQGLVFGYACDETPQLMPLPIALSHRLLQRHAQVRQEGLGDQLGPDAKSQVTVRYHEADAAPQAVVHVLVSSQHHDELSESAARDPIRRLVIEPVLASVPCADDLQVLVNPTGRFVTGGPAADVGLTGRKIIVDTYGGAAPHGGGAFSGKDPTKVDRSGAYMARYVAKNLVAAGLARRCTVQFAYAIGEPDPVSVRIDTHGTGTCPAATLVAAVRRHFDLSPAGIIERLSLRRPIYRRTAVFGHFGREEPEFTWERVDAAEALSNELG